MRTHSRNQQRWANPLSRWSTPSVFCRLWQILKLAPSSAKHFDWPSPDEMTSKQEEHADHRSSKLKLVDKIWRKQFNAIWTPDDTPNLQRHLAALYKLTRASTVDHSQYVHISSLPVFVIVDS